MKPLGPVPVKGLAANVEVHEVTGAGPARTRLQVAAARGLTRFVGRDAELEQLRRVQQLAATGHGQVAAVVGEAGVGKSRLLHEFTHSHRLQGWLVLEGASVSYGKATSYLPVIDLLKAYLKIQDRDDLRDIPEKVTGTLLTLDRALEPTLPALLALLDVPVNDVSWRALDPAQRRQQTLDAVKRLLLREAREQPLLLIFEDLHWIDSETQALLDGLVDSLGSARLLLLVTYRPEYRHPWGGKTSYNQLRLDALQADRAGELLDALLGDHPGLGPLKQLLVKRGNPFFLEETLQTLVETKALAGGWAHYLAGEYERAVELATNNLAALPAEWVDEFLGNATPASIYDRVWLVVSLAELGRFAEAAQCEAEAIQLAEPTHHAFTLGQIYRSAATLHYLKGDWTKARLLIENAITVLRTGNFVILAYAVAPSAWVLAQLGEAREALNRIREGEQLLEGHAVRGFVGISGWAYHSLGRACLLLGRLDEAQSLGDRAVESSGHQPGFAAHALHLLGDIATHPDRFDAEIGEAHYRQALALAEPRGMRPLVAHCHLGLGKLYRRTGKRGPSREHLATATTMYREMDMRFWLEPAEAELTALG